MSISYLFCSGVSTLMGMCQPGLVDIMLTWNIALLRVPWWTITAPPAMLSCQHQILQPPKRLLCLLQQVRPRQSLLQMHQDLISCQQVVVQLLRHYLFQLPQLLQIHLSQNILHHQTRVLTKVMILVLHCQKGRLSESRSQLQGYLPQ